MIVRRRKPPLRAEARIGYPGDFAPFAYFDGRAAAGSLVDVIDSASRRIGISPHYVVLDHSDATARLTDGSIDAFVPMAVTPARRQQFGFSRTLAMTGGAWFVIQKELLQALSAKSA